MFQPLTIFLIFSHYRYFDLYTFNLIVVINNSNIYARTLHQLYLKNFKNFLSTKLLKTNMLIKFVVGSCEHTGSRVEVRVQEAACFIKIFMITLHKE